MLMLDWNIPTRFWILILAHCLPPHVISIYLTLVVNYLENTLNPQEKNKSQKTPKTLKKLTKKHTKYSKIKQE
jgi:hypothetical protein